jgi:adenine-specific DNA-methyltransferase
MPVLDWIGKKAVVNHHRDVPYRLLHCDKSKSAGDLDARKFACPRAITWRP